MCQNQTLRAKYRPNRGRGHICITIYHTFQTIYHIRIRCTDALPGTQEVHNTAGIHQLHIYRVPNNMII